MSERWPVAELDPVRRLRVMAAATPGTVLVEAHVAAPFEKVWAVASDLEGELPHLISDFRWVRVTRAEGERVEFLARGRLGQRGRFDAVLRPGWCWMRSRFVIGGLAAVPEAGGTRFALLGGLRVPGMRLAHPLLERLGGRIGARLARRLERRVALR